LELTKEALKLSGTLGEMTDVKVVPGYKAAAAIKMPGVADPSPIHEELHRWIIANGYIPAGAPVENLLVGSTNSKYKSVKSEITIPVIRPRAEDKESK
jgi:hypothetical protein